MNLLLGPALGLVLSPTDLRSFYAAILDQRASADFDCLIEGNRLVLDEAALLKVFITLLLLLRLIVGRVGGVAPSVIAVVALDDIIILCLLDHLHLVDTPPAVGAYPAGRHTAEAGCAGTTTALSRLQGADWHQAEIGANGFILEQRDIYVSYTSPCLFVM